MYIIKPTTRKRWTETLEEEHQVDESNAETIVDFIVGDPRVSMKRPQTENELEATVNDVATVIDEIRLTEFGGIEDHDKVRDTLIDMLRADLGLDQRPSKKTEQQPTGQPSSDVAGSASSPTPEPISQQPTAFANRETTEPSEDKPPVRLAPFIDQLVERVENEDSEFTQDDVQRIAKWVIYKTQD